MQVLIRTLPSSPLYDLSLLHVFYPWNSNRRFYPISELSCASLDGERRHTFYPFPKRSGGLSIAAPLGGGNL